MSLGLMLMMPVLFAMAATAGLIILIWPLLQHYALAKPNARSAHRIPTPQGGGLPIILATMGASALTLALWAQPASGLAGIAPVMAAAALLAFVGAVDDVRGVAVLPRLAVQAVAVALALAWLPEDLRVFPGLALWGERLLLLLAGLWFVNLVNFMDGLDWMTVAEVIPITGGLVILGLLGALPFHALVVALALFGAMLGFAPFNRPVARLFMGDVGSLPIGLLLGWMLVLLAGGGHIAAALLLPLYYVADASFTLLRRLLAGEQIWRAHRSHYYQRAADAGLPVLRIVGTVFGVNLALAGLAILTVMSSDWLHDLIAVLVGASLVGALLFFFGRQRR